MLVYECAPSEQKNSDSLLLSVRGMIGTAVYLCCVYAKGGVHPVGVRSRETSPNQGAVIPGNGAVPPHWTHTHTDSDTFVLITSPSSQQFFATELLQDVGTVVDGLRRRV